MHGETINTKYIVFCGASASAIGKGITVSSTAALLKAAGFKIGVIKIDPYLNIDAGTMSPYEHGEVYVLDDGGEADLDLGNYERFLNINLTVNHNITTGKLYQRVLDQERKGHYLGKTVQIVPHVTNELMKWIQRVALVPTNEDFDTPEICLIELGGTVGDIESALFLEGIRQMQNQIGHENMAICLVTYIPVFGSEGQPKTKPAQHGFKELRYVGLTPDFIMARSEDELEDEIMQKLSLFSGVPMEKVLNIPDLDSVYQVPLLLEKNNFLNLLSKRLHFGPRKMDLIFWQRYYFKDLQVRKEKSNESVIITFVGKYIEFKDAYLSVLKAFDQAAIETGIRIDMLFVEAEHLEAPKNPEEVNKRYNLTKKDLYDNAWANVKKGQGIFVAGGFGIRGAFGKMGAIKHARENKIPLFGVCYGFQLIVIEFCRNVLKWNAISEEFTEELPKDDTHKKVIIFMPEISKDTMGGNMRLGNKRIVLDKSDCLAKRIYNQHVIYERHRHRYEVEPKYIKEIEAAGLKFTATDETRIRQEICEYADHPFMFATQYHPELKGRLEKPSPPFVAFVLASAKKLDYNTKIEGGVLNFSQSIATKAYEKLEAKMAPYYKKWGNILVNGEQSETKKDMMKEEQEKVVKQTVEQAKEVTKDEPQVESK